MTQRKSENSVDAHHDEDESLLLNVAEPDGRRLVVLEDDGVVAYAYLLDDGKIVGDVWLYNVGQDPEVVDWKDKTKLPFRNAARFCSRERPPRLHQTLVCLMSLG